MIKIVDERKVNEVNSFLPTSIVKPWLHHFPFLTRFSSACLLALSGLLSTNIAHATPVSRPPLTPPVCYPEYANLEFVDLEFNNITPSTGPIQTEYLVEDVGTFAGTPLDMRITYSPAPSPSNTSNIPKIVTGEDILFNTHKNVPVTATYEFFVANTNTPAPINAIFRSYDIDQTESIEINLSEIDGYNVNFPSNLTLTDDGTTLTVDSIPNNRSTVPEDSLEYFIVGRSSFSIRYITGTVNGGHFIDGDLSATLTRSTCFDYGDAPDTGAGTGNGNYNTTESDSGPRHNLATSSSYLGSGVTPDINGFGNGTDNNNNASDDTDDDGVQLSGASLQGQSLTAGNTVNLDITTVGSGVLNAWIDWNGDGDFTDTGEQIATDADVSSGTLNVNVPAGATVGTTYARFRYSTQTGLAPTGAASDGEVEDYQIAIASSVLSISGTVFEDINYGGGAGRDYTTADAASTLPIDTQNATVELYELQSGNYIKVADTTTGTDGTYSFSDAVVKNNTTYRVRVVNATVKSRRDGGGGNELPVQTFRNDPDAVAGSQAITSEVGGATPTGEDAGAQANGANLSTITAQSVTEVVISSSGISNVDFGFNFNTIVNTNNQGQGSLSQFITNANRLGDEASLAQQGNRKDKYNANEALPTGTDNSIFMIPSASDPLGRTADPNFDTGRGVAQITAVNKLEVVGNQNGGRHNNTSVDATTQTVNIGDTNAGTLGTGGTVGVDALTLDLVQRPEVEIVGNRSSETLGVFDASNVTIRGFAVYNSYRSFQSFNSNNLLLEQNIFGSFADSYTNPGGQRDVDLNILFNNVDDSIIRNNLTGFANNRDSVNVDNDSNNVLYENNECVSPGFGSQIGDCFIFVNRSNGGTVRGNLLRNAAANGVDLLINVDDALVENNTIINAGANSSPSTGSSTGVGESAGVRISNYDGGFNPDANTSDNNTVRRNIISGSTGQGVLITGGTGNLVTQNSLFDNTGIGINLGTYTERTIEARDVGIYPFQTPNDGPGGTTAGANRLIDFPVFESAEIVGGNLIVRGFAPAGANLEIFIADPPPNPDPLPAAFSSTFNEGQEYLVTLQEGGAQDTDATTGTYTDDGTGATSTKTQNRFEFTIPVPTGVFGNLLTTENLLTATATIDNNTSEFSGTVSIGSDYGDAPDSYGTLSASNGARHGITPGLFIGATSPDADTDGFSNGTDDNTNATDDDSEGSGDEGGITLPALSDDDTSYSLTVPVTNQLGGDANLVAWIDFDQNGTFDSDEAATVVVSSNAAVQSMTLNWSSLPGITGGNTYLRLRLTTDPSIATGTATTSLPTGAARDGEVEDYQIEIIPGYEISPSAGKIILNEVLYNETGNSAATNDEFIEVFNASTSPVDISDWQLIDGNIIAKDTDNIGSITGNSSPYLFPNGTILQPGEYIVIWIGDNTPDHQATTATFQAWLEKSPKLNNSGDDVWLYDKDGKIVDYVAYGSGSAINTPLPNSLNQWDDTHQTALAGASDGQSISLTKNGLDGNTSACWEHSTSGNANTQGCTNFLPTKDTDDVGSRINSAGQNNNGTPSVLLVKRVTALNNQPYTNIVDGVDTGNSTSTNYVPAPKDADDNHPNWLSNFLQGEINNVKVQPDDEIEYTVYFLSTGSTGAKNVLVCDRIPDNITFLTGEFNSLTPATGGITGSSRGILWFKNGNTESLTNSQDGDAAQYFPPGVDPTTVYPTANCGGTNTNGAVVVNLGDLPNSTAPGTPNTSYGYIRFRGKVK